LIRLEAKRSNLGWNLYDEQHRLRKARDPSTSFSKIDYELWLLYIGNAIGPQMGATSVPTNNNSVLKCYTYHFEGQRLKPHCSFKNLCWRCGGGHPVICCPLKQEHKPVDTCSISRPRFQRFGGHQIQDVGFVHQTLKRFSDKDLLSQLWIKGSTHIKSDVLGRYLVCYPNQLVARELYRGFTEGFRLQYTGPVFLCVRQI
jgi:hypothetical protein